MHLHLIPVIRQTQTELIFTCPPKLSSSFANKQAIASVNGRWGRWVPCMRFCFRFSSNTACTHVSRLLNAAFTARAYCQAAAGCHMVVFERLLERTTQAAQTGGDDDQTARSSHILDRRLQFLDARHTRVATPFRTVGKATRRLRVSGGSSAGAVRCRSRAVVEGAGGTPLRTHDMSARAIVARSGAVTRRPLGGRSRSASFVHLASAFSSGKSTLCFASISGSWSDFRRDRSSPGKRPRRPPCTPSHG